MRQISIYTKFNHHSDKDLTISRGDKGNINMTFRNASWLAFTASDYIGFYATKDGTLTITDGKSNPRATVRYKLNQSGTVPSRYIHVSTAADADVRKALEKILRDKDFINLDIVPDDQDGGVNDIYLKADDATPEPDTKPLEYNHDKTPVKKNVETFRDGDGLMVRVDLLKSTPEVRKFFLESLTRDDLVNECLYLLDKLGGL